MCAAHNALVEVGTVLAELAEGVGVGVALLHNYIVILHPRLGVLVLMLSHGRLVDSIQRPRIVLAQVL